MTSDTFPGASDLLERYFYPFSLDFLRLVAWLLILLVIFVPLEALFSDERTHPFRKGFLADVGYYFLNGLLPKLLLVFPMAAIAWALRFVIPTPVTSFFSHLPLWCRLLGSLVVGEIGFYWGHRWSHDIPFLWRIHSVHHAPEKMYWLVNTRAHPLDIVFTRLCSFIPMYALGLVQPVGVETLDTMPLLLLLIGTLWGFFIHSDLRWRLGYVSEIIATPAFHHWHHTRDTPLDKNFASMLPVVDRIFGTHYLPKGQWPPHYGISQPAQSAKGEIPNATIE